MYQAIAAQLQQETEGKDKNKAEGKRQEASQGFGKLEAMGLFNDTKGNFQRELRERKLVLLAKDRAKVLSLNDISEHNTYMIATREKLSQRKEAITKKARMVSVLFNRTKDQRRSAMLARDTDKIKTAERNFNEDVAAYNAELAWFHSCPSFKKAQEHIKQNWVSLGSGDKTVYVPRAEVEQDEADDFESMLQAMKLEQVEQVDTDS
mmetsp:Transcript_23533/g.36815  ORF Transcript_23533/g.36815 Transcript_23533/m.36815 type:complete len:207 (-) Transcript_23533:643-1263(-)|eukprot:CAMPEP_0184325388 /NCGR_PEP_ID=MMETSP1049-20130417/140063_1 /TAXON_ID=77928 /ORGANISM="Proteomonas sulcata, Strain CCMP704" /LENGTH=206 /DNA_ID=CAMNT_0026647421 /DNA_START=31 /DNA_END=651 /DNA_ORIENTATION=-